MICCDAFLSNVCCSLFQLFLFSITFLLRVPHKTFAISIIYKLRITLSSLTTNQNDVLLEIFIETTGSSQKQQHSGCVENNVPPGVSRRTPRHASDLVSRVPLVATEESRGCSTTGQQRFMNNAGTPRPPDTGTVMLLLHRDQWR